MQPEEIKDRESLIDWLETQSPEACILIASRAAARVAPIWFRSVEDEWASALEINALHVLQPLCISIVAINNLSQEIRSAAFAASYYSSKAAETDKRLNATFASAYASSSSADCAAVAFVGEQVDGGRFAAVASTAADAVAFANIAVPTAWDLVLVDCRALQLGDWLNQAPLWHNQPNPLDAEWQATRTKWQAPNSPYRFWLRWYEAALQGQHLNLDLEHDIALIPSEDWEKGPDHIATLIDALERKYAIAATDNAERIEVNPETGKLRLIAETDLPDDIAAYARRKITRAVAVFGEAPENQYSALTPDLKMLREAVEDAENLPMELFDACASASRRLGLRAKGGECPEPEKDPLLQDYLHRIREAGADILAHDPKTQDVLERRSAILGNNALIDARETVIAGADLIAPITEGRLKTALLQDAETATNPNAPEEERKAASFKVAGRALRISGVLAVVGGAAGATYFAISAYPSFVEGAGLIWRDPLMQKLVDLILRYLGM